MLRMTVVGDKALVATLRGAVRKMHGALVKALRKAGMLVAGEAKRQVYQGHPKHLEGDSGQLRKSIHYDVHEGALVARVGSNLVYAPVHEYGAVIEPVRASVLAWQDKEGEWHFAKRVRIPARPYLRPALEKKDQEVPGIILRAAEELFQI